jgi:hypothetical protein
MANTSTSGRPAASARAPTRQPLGDAVHEGHVAGGVGADDAVRDAAERRAEALSLGGEGALGVPAPGDVAEAPDATHLLAIDHLAARHPLEDPPVGEGERVEAVGRARGVELAHARDELLGIVELTRAHIEILPVIARIHHLGGDAPHGGVFGVHRRHRALGIGREDAVGGRLERRVQHGERVRQARVEAVARLEDAARVLQRDRAELLVLVTLGHQSTPSACDASAVPATRAWIFAKATSRVVEVSSQKGEKPQSSVVPS